MTVLVTISYYGCAATIERAVRSVLAQTHDDLRLLVIGDGEEPPLAVPDPRLTVHVMRRNRGTYFAHQAALMASPHEWYAPVDADDWVEPDHLETLLAMDAPAVLAGAVWFHSFDATRRVKDDATYWFGLYRTERLRAIGGFTPHERIGQDRLAQQLVRMSGPFAVSRTATYHRIKRKGSLTSHPETGIHSRYRAQVAARTRRVLRACREAEDVRAYRESLVPPDVAAALSEEVGRLRRVL